jgi:hypothetical protein
MPRQAVWAVLIGVGVLGGCSGGYVLTAPDAVCPVGGQAPAVVRLQRKELPLVAPPAQAAPLRFQVAGGPARAARTDAKGYASTSVPVPQAAGVYPMTVTLQDVQGQEAAWELRAFVWDPDRPVVAVDLQAVPHGGREAEDAKAALKNLALHANVLYLSGHSVAKFPKLRKALEAAGLPEGPILSWRVAGWRRDKVVSPLGDLRKVFPKLEVGVAGSSLAVRAFESTGMTCLVVGGGVSPRGQAVRRTSWKELAEKGEAEMGLKGN